MSNFRRRKLNTSVKSKVLTFRSFLLGNHIFNLRSNNIEDAFIDFQNEIANTYAIFFNFLNFNPSPTSFIVISL